MCMCTCMLVVYGERRRGEPAHIGDDVECLAGGFHPLEDLL